eukprot:TRINITY_DN14760_c0_g1_i1.p1 TRINITY_DN14760_c0_g1~~TRINITY_DN14760_c0_g1_i1.p1  ORF type:complete len:266 (-),score=13.19 TRINITY_DN14760_c0_g1_i1:785-1582(-)
MCAFLVMSEGEMSSQATDALASHQHRATQTSFESPAGETQRSRRRSRSRRRRSRSCSRRRSRSRCSRSRSRRRASHRSASRSPERKKARSSESSGPEHIKPRPHSRVSFQLQKQMLRDAWEPQRVNAGLIDGALCTREEIPDHCSVTVAQLATKLGVAFMDSSDATGLGRLQEPRDNFQGQVVCPYVTVAMELPDTTDTDPMNVPKANLFTKGVQYLSFKRDLEAFYKAAKDYMRRTHLTATSGCFETASWTCSSISLPAEQSAR